MEILALLSLFYSLVSFIEAVIYKGDRWFFIAIYLAAFLTSLVPVTYSVYEFFSSPRSKMKRILRSLENFIYTTNLNKVISDKMMKNQNLYCNPFTNESMNCSHGMHLIFSKNEKHCDFDEDDDTFVLLYAVLKQNCESTNVFSRNDKNYFVIREEGILKTTENLCLNEMRSLYNKDVCEYFHYKAKILSQTIKIKYSIQDKVISFEQSDSRSIHVLKKSFKNSRIDHMIYLIKIFHYVIKTGRNCCFVIDHERTKIFKNGSRLHCINVSELFEEVIEKDSRIDRVWFENYPKFVENNHLNIMNKGMLEKFGNKSKIFIEYINQQPPEKQIYLFKFAINCESANYKNNFMFDNKEKRIMTNWKWKRFCTDLSFLRELCKFPCLHFVDKKIPPTKKCLNFSKMEKYENLLAEENDEKIFHCIPKKEKCIFVEHLKVFEKREILGKRNDRPTFISDENSKIFGLYDRICKLKTKLKKDDIKNKNSLSQYQTDKHSSNKNLITSLEKSVEKIIVGETNFHTKTFREVLLSKNKREKCFHENKLPVFSENVKKEIDLKERLNSLKSRLLKNEKNEGILKSSSANENCKKIGSKNREKQENFKIKCGKSIENKNILVKNKYHALGEYKDDEKIDFIKYSTVKSRLLKKISGDLKKSWKKLKNKEEKKKKEENFAENEETIENFFHKSMKKIKEEEEKEKKILEEMKEREKNEKIALIKIREEKLKNLELDFEKIAIFGFNVKNLLKSHFSDEIDVELGKINAFTKNMSILVKDKKEEEKEKGANSGLDFLQSMRLNRKLMKKEENEKRKKIKSLKMKENVNESEFAFEDEDYQWRYWA
jgi:hypothetical protein